MKIRLNEIPEAGREYQFDRQSAELNSVLSDLIHQGLYDIKLNLRPITNRDFEVTGFIKTQTHEFCAMCGAEFQFAIQQPVREILIPEPSPDRTGKYAKSKSSNHLDLSSETTGPASVNSDPNSETNNDETTLNVSTYKSSQFDLGEFLHEAIALEVPLYPRCPQCKQSSSEQPFVYDESMGEAVQMSPFEGLKNLKLPS